MNSGTGYIFAVLESRYAYIHDPFTDENSLTSFANATRNRNSTNVILGSCLRRNRWLPNMVAPMPELPTIIPVQSDISGGRVGQK